MNYEFSPRSSISEEIEEDLEALNNNDLSFNNNSTINKSFKAESKYEYAYISPKNHYEISDMSSDDDDDFDNPQSRETARDKYNRSYSRLDFQDSEELQYNEMYKYYKLNKNQYEELALFYESNKSLNGLFSVKLLNSLLTNAIESRNDKIIASERDINRILSLIDNDHDGYVNMTQMINLLSLLFAQKSNLTERIESVGFNKTNLDTDSMGKSLSNRMTPFEADAYLDYLNEFFSPDVIGLLEFDESVEINEFAEKVTVFYQGAVFVV